MVVPFSLYNATKSGKSSDVLASKLCSLYALSESDVNALAELPVTEKTIKKDKDFVTEHELQWSGFLVREGMAVRYRMMPDGNRQILSLLIPGDLCHARYSPIRPLNHSISTITQLKIALIPQEKITALCNEHPNIRTVMWLCTLQEEAILHERIISLGRRDARSRISHLLCELFWRYEAVGLANTVPFQIPLTQTELGDLLGLTQVHVNRVLKTLRESGSIKVENRKLHVCNVAELQNIADFSQEYLGFL